MTNLFNDKDLERYESLQRTIADMETAHSQQVADLHKAVCGLGLQVKALRERLDSIESSGQIFGEVWREAIVLIPDDEPNKFRLATVIAYAAIHGDNKTRIAEASGMNWRTVRDDLDRAARVVTGKLPDEVDDYLAGGKYADAPRVQNSQDLYEMARLRGLPAAKEVLVNP